MFYERHPKVYFLNLILSTFLCFITIAANCIWFSLPLPFKFPFSSNRVTSAFIANIREILMTVLVNCLHVVTWWGEEGPEGLLYRFNFIQDLFFGDSERSSSKQLCSGGQKGKIKRQIGHSHSSVFLDDKHGCCWN